jgi:hypothetical protein
VLAPVKALAERNAIDLSGGDDDAIVTVLVALAGRSPNAPEGAEIQFRLRYRSNLHRLTLSYAGAIHQLLGDEGFYARTRDTLAFRLVYKGRVLDSADTPRSLGMVRGAPNAMSAVAINTQAIETHRLRGEADTV